MVSALGYVFWHRPISGTPRAGYEARLLGFQRSLKAHPPVGLMGAYSFREEVLPWSAVRSGAYEDWYLVKGFRALGDLNAAAVDSENKGPHDDAAKGASAIAGGVYSLREGRVAPGEVRVATWLHKPAGVTYEAFLEVLLSSLGGRRSAIWQRQMVLGPAPEFCLHTLDGFPLPRGLRGRVVRVKQVAEGGD